MSLLVLLHAIGATLWISVPTVLEALFNTVTYERSDARLRSWSKSLLKRVGATVVLEGAEQIKASSGPFIIISNHESQYDIPVLFAALPLSLRMVAKKEIFRIPIWGKAMRASGFIELDRTNRELAFRALQNAGRAMKQNSTSLFIAPEGTRSVDNRLGSFKLGAFHLAQATNFPILPIAIHGAGSIHRKGDRFITRGCIVKVELLPLMFVNASDSPKEIATKARTKIAQALETQRLTP